MTNPDNLLNAWRGQIDIMDTQLLELLALRQQVVQAIGDYKKVEGLPPLDEARWQSLLQANIAKGKSLGLCPDFIHSLYHLIHEYSLLLESQQETEPASSQSPCSP